MTIPAITTYAAATPARVSPALAVLLGLSMLAHGLVLLVQLDFSAVYAPPHTSMLRVKLATQTTQPDGDETASTVTTAIADSVAKPKQPAARQATALSTDTQLPRSNALAIETNDKAVIAQQTVDSTLDAGPEKAIPTSKPSTKTVDTPPPAMPTAPASKTKSTLVMNTAVAPEAAPDAMAEPLLKASLQSSHDSKASNTNHAPANERQTLLEEIHRALSRHVDYPLRARRRGWEGEVLLAFNLSQLGLIDNIHVARSSGYSLLDESALNALQKVKGISWRLYEGRLPMTGLEIPVLYRLTDG